MRQRVEVQVQCAIDGIGLAYCLELHVQRYIDDGELVPVLLDWSPVSKGFICTIPVGDKCLRVFARSST